MSVKNYPKDARWIKITVWLAFAMETVIAVLTAIATWNTFGVGWGKVEALRIIDKSWSPLPIFNSLTAMIAQTFFAWRIWKLTHKIWISTGITILATAGSAFAWYYNIRIDLMGRHVEAVSSLYKAHTAAAVSNTAATLMNILKFTVETGLITAVWSVIELSLWLSMPGNSFHWIFFLARGRIYNNWLLATLNSRIYVSNLSSLTYVSMNFDQQSAMWADMPTNVDAPGSRAHRFGRVHITTTTEAHIDQEMVVISSDSPPQTKAHLSEA
ncbi:hypothetical protein PTI98_000221 [Pleurotus ostreatus]|nr:hypothetical protein PTI98_000221 [Pleurotus ostreatus]